MIFQTSGWYDYQRSLGQFNCPICERLEDDDYGCTSEVTGEMYCCEECLEEAEQNYKENNWYCHEGTGEFFKTKEELISVYLQEGENELADKLIKEEK